MLILCYVYVIVICDGVCVGDMINILCGDLFLTLKKTSSDKEIMRDF